MNKNKKFTQNDRVLHYLILFGSMTQIEAVRELGCLRLASRISDLKQKGHRISDHWEIAKNRWGEEVRFKRYTLNHPDLYKRSEHDWEDVPVVPASRIMHKGVTINA